MRNFNWVLTDDDCCQYIRAVTEVGPRCYECVQLIEYPAELSEKLGSEYGIAHAFVDLDDYSVMDLWDILRCYYESAEIVYLSQEIKAECMFETEALNNIEQNASNRQEAESLIQDILWQDVLIVNKDDESDNYAFLPIITGGNDSIANLLKVFDELYGDTEQDLSEWAAEFQIMTRMLVHHNAVLVNPVHLEMDEETVEKIIACFPFPLDQAAYKEARKYLSK